MNINHAYQHSNVQHDLIQPCSGLPLSCKIVFLLKQRSMSADQLGFELHYKNVHVILRLLNKLSQSGIVRKTMTVSMNRDGRFCPVWAYVRG